MVTQAGAKLLLADRAQRSGVCCKCRDDLRSNPPLDSDSLLATCTNSFLHPVGFPPHP